MCFSATASFAAGSVLAVAGVATVTKATKKELLLASIPLLFGVQQIADGIVWLTSEISPLHTIAIYAYSAFAFAFWPVFTPLAVRLVETDPIRRKVLDAFLIVGIGVSTFFAYALIVGGAAARVLHNCIAYATPHEYGMLSLAFYLVVVCGSFFVSSKKLLRLFGLVLLLSFAIAGWFYVETFSSTWCFFGALLSSILFLYFHVGFKK